VTAALNGAPVPVTLITGFLGAGKTTLVRHILTARHGRRIAVVLNEYGGEGDIEAAFVRTEGGADAPAPHWVELANGCLCCSVKGEFLQAIEALVASGLAPGGSGGGGPQAEQPQQGEGQQQQSGRGAVEAVLVEASGLADPGPVVAALWGDEELEPAALLDGVVTVVDAAHIGRQLAERRAGGAANEAQVQVALADVVLLNKVG
jgi:G3E family GTPase